MELQEFISSALTQIMGGITKAASELPDNGAVISPDSINIAREKSRQGGVLGTYSPGKNFPRPVQRIDFDIAVTVLEGKETNGAIGVATGSVALESKGQSNTDSSSISRIRFTVPVVLPSGNME